MSYTGLKLNFTLAYRETSKDSNAETTKIRIENGKIFIDREYGGFKAGKNTKVEKGMDEVTEKHIMDFIIDKHLNTNIEELKPTDNMGISGYLKIELFGDEPSKLHIEGKTNIWGSDDYIKQNWGEKYLESKTNIDNIKYFKAADELVQFVIGL